jgi:hypothetical protein
MPAFRPPLIVLLGLLPTLHGVAAVDFSRQIRPILSENCFFCHGPDENKREAGLRLDDETEAKKNRDGVTAVVPGRPEQSALLQRILSTDPDEVMPPPKQHKVIPPEQIALLRQWIREGAPWGAHWSYQPVRRPPVPQMAAEGARNPVDAFLLERLQREGLKFAPEAESAALLRRAALDLTGLPPTLRELDALREAPLEVVVDHYLASPAYGEHWARQWLDLARYADSSGYPSDQPRTIWAWRDWVIRAFDANLPFDRFTIEQIAGDLLPQPTPEQLTATAFHRNTMTQNEGGTSDEEYRVAAVIDRVNTTFAVWMGTTMACAQCHTHKYDPITHREYFQVYHLLNQTADADRKDESPFLELIDAATAAQRAGWQREVAALEAQFAKPAPAWVQGFETWLAGKPELGDKKLQAAAAAAVPTPAQRHSLRLHYARHVAPAARAERSRLAELQRDLARTAPVTVPVMRELPSKERRKTHVQRRGNWQDLGEEVSGGVPAVFHPLTADAPADRLALARWLVRRDNPLTARVVANRLWESVFGTGLVATSEEFGSQGELPSHPELLDWLAVELMESGWNVKHLLRLLVTSRAWRQQSAAPAALVERDPDNRLLARGPRFRPTGEQLRDQALLVSGLLSSKRFGPPVRPLAPNLGLSTAFGRSNDWTISEGEDRHRRSLYTEVRRNAPYASFSAFDAGNREVCLIRRGRTNTPLQAFVTLNDPVFVEAHQAMARRLVAAAPATEARLSLLFRLCLAREPSERERASLQALLDDARRRYRADPEGARRMATEPLGPPPQGGDLLELAAWTVVTNVVMNLDEFLMRR